MPRTCWVYSRLREGLKSAGLWPLPERLMAVGGESPAKDGASTWTPSSSLVKADQEELARLISQDCGKAIAEARVHVIEGIHTAQYWSGSGRTPAGGLGGVGGRPEGELRAAEAQGSGGGHWSVQLPIRHPPVAHLPVSDRGQHRGSKGVLGDVPLTGKRGLGPTLLLFPSVTWRR